jgi:hypothetical protein
MPMPPILRRAASRFRQNEAGALTAFGLYILLGGMIFGGLALDVGYAYRTRTALQTAADAAAHAALYVRQDEDLATARAAAVRIVQGSLPPGSYGEVLRPEDVNFGHWDRDRQLFTIDNASRDAVVINAGQLAERHNAARAFLLNFVGISSWDVVSMAVFETWTPACLREGFVAEGRVDMQSNNSFHNGFCIHSNSHVEFSSNNLFEPGVTVSMPDKDRVVARNHNVGLEEALRDAQYPVRILSRLSGMIDGLEAGEDELTPDYIKSRATKKLSKKNNLDAKDFTAGRIHVSTCRNGTISIEAGTVLEKIVLVTDCAVSFGQGVELRDVVIASRSTSRNAIKAASGLTVGRDDGCATGGGAQILALGDMRFPAKLNMYGGQLVARGNIDFAANARGIEGASIIAGGEIDGTSRASMGFCGTGMEQNFEVPLFRLAG